MQLPVFFLTCDQQLSFFFWNRKIIEFLCFLGLHFRQRNLSCKSQTCTRTVKFAGKLRRIRRSRRQRDKYWPLAGHKNIFVPNHRLRATSSSVLLSSVVFILLVLNILITIEGYQFISFYCHVLPSLNKVVTYLLTFE